MDTFTKIEEGGKNSYKIAQFWATWVNWVFERFENETSLGDTAFIKDLYVNSQRDDNGNPILLFEHKPQLFSSEDDFFTFFRSVLMEQPEYWYARLRVVGAMYIELPERALMPIVPDWRIVETLEHLT